MNLHALKDGEVRVDGFEYLVRMEKRCGGRVTVTGSRMEPKDVVYHVNNVGLKEFFRIWDYLPPESIDECFRIVKDHPEEEDEDTED